MRERRVAVLEVSYCPQSEQDPLAASDLWEKALAAGGVDGVYVAVRSDVPLGRGSEADGQAV